MKNQCYEFIKGADNRVQIAGFGSYGQVKLAKNTDTGDIVAIKMINGRNAKNQIDVHHKLSHPNIIRLLNYYYQKQKNVTYMVLQYAQEGTLHNKIKFGYGQLSKDKVKKYFRDVCKAVQYLHSNKFMHRDIKPQNILLTKDGHAKLCDFGFAAILEYRSTLCGTYQYMAPQMIQQKPYDYKVDIWALGILLFELIQGVAPFRGESGQDVINQMKKPIIFSNRFEKQQKELIKKILRVNADNRPSIANILQQPYIAEIPQNQVQQKVEKNLSNSTSRTLSSLSNQQSHEISKGTDGSKFQSLHESIVYEEAPQIQGSKTQIKMKKLEKKQKQVEKFEKTQKQKQQKQFKHFIPTGVKSSNITSLKPTSSYLSNSTTSSNNNQPIYQSFGTSSQVLSQTNNVAYIANQNNSVDFSIAYRQQVPVPNFIPNQKMTINPNSKVSYTAQTVPNTSQIKLTNYIPGSNFSIQNSQILPNTQITQSQTLHNPQNIPNYFNPQSLQGLQSPQNAQNFSQWRKN